MTVQVLIGNTLDVLRTLPSESVQCCVTSPPYWGLRSYLPEGHEDKHMEIGLERTPQEFVVRMVEVFREVRRVLRPDGVCWVNLGDSYAGGGERQTGRNDSDRKTPGGRGVSFRGGTRQATTQRDGLKPKDLIGIPWRVALALQDDGWWLRQDIIWHKPNPMPESVTDRCTKAHEYVFMLTKSARYFFDADAIKEPAAYDGPNSPQSIASPYGQGFTRRGSQAWSAGASRSNPQQDSHGGLPTSDPSRRNKRSVWTIATAPFSEAHFAAFPPELPEICIKASTKPGDTVLDPFGGAGTSGLVADRLQRHAILIELNPEYAAMAERRINGDRGLLLDMMEAAE